MSPKPQADLTETQLELLDRIEIDSTLESIAADLEVSPSTIATRIKRLRWKLGTHAPVSEFPRIAKERGLWSEWEGEDDVDSDDGMV